MTCQRQIPADIKEHADLVAAPLFDGYISKYYKLSITEAEALKLLKE